uniref:Aa_trans domain-containing protein n=1 Tax=Ascaris lumbricoides TaxID=6252 RepID=A0A0M3III1_ASCLU
MFVICIFFAYTAHLLGENWVIMRERWPEYRQHCRKPYPEIALRSMGPNMKVAASIVIYVTLFGTAVVFILLSSRIIQHLLASIFGVQISFCYLLCIVSLAIMPLTYLKSPADFWLVIVVAMLCTISAVALVLLGVSFDMSACLPEARYPPFKASSAVLSLGTFLFAFSGHHAFPTIQHDMKRPHEFTKSVMLGFIMIALLYMPLSVYGYVVYGDSMYSSVIDSVQTTWIRYAADLSIAIHCILTLIIMANPLNQQAEDALNAPHTFGLTRVVIRSCVLGAMLFCALTIPDFGPFMNLHYHTIGMCHITEHMQPLPERLCPRSQDSTVHASIIQRVAFGLTRVVIRSCVLGAMLFCALTIPDFGPFMNLVGSTTIPLVCAILPSICNLYLNASVLDHKTQQYTLASFNEVWSHGTHFTSTSVALVAGVVSAYMSLEEITLVHFTPPCYLRPFLSVEPSLYNGELISCCGMNRNILASGNTTELCRI